MGKRIYTGLVENPGSLGLQGTRDNQRYKNTMLGGRGERSETEGKKERKIDLPLVPTTFIAIISLIILHPPEETKNKVLKRTSR